MKKALVPVFLVTAIVIVLITNLYFVKPGRTKTDLPKGDGFAVVELFTSEGCSSCPPADALAAKISDQYNGKVYVLGFHVDYWDNANWRDVYSNAAYSKRQELYSAYFNLNSVYTPQVIVNGKTEMVGSDENKLRRTIDAELKNTSSNTITADAKSGDNNLVNVSYTTSATKGEILHIVLVQLHAQTTVSGGENGGHVLHHINVVRDFKTIDISKNGVGNISLILPEGLSAKDCKVIAYVQDAGDYAIKAATAALIQ